MISQYLWAGREVCRRYFFGSADMLHVCEGLFMFVHRDWFVNPRHNLDFPTGGVSFWTTRQDGGDVGENIASTEEATTSLDGANASYKEVTSATQTKLAVVIGPLKTATELETHTYILHSLLGWAIPVVESILPLVN